MKTPLKINQIAVLLVASLFFTNMAKAQIVINADIVDSGGNFSYIAISADDLTPVASGTIDFFWFDAAASTATITAWTSASDWTGSILYSNRLGSLSIGAGYDGAAGLFAGGIDVASLASGAVGKNFAAAITSGTRLGVFRFADVLPANAAIPPPSPVGAILADVNAGGAVLVGSVNVNGTFSYGGNSFPGEAYALVPEPATLSLVALAGSVLLASGRRKKS